MTQRQCCKHVFDGRGAGGHPCQRPATVNQDGKWFCWQHDPERIAREEEKRHSRWRRKRQAEDRRWRRRAAEQHACDKVPTEVLERISVPKLLAACEAFVKTWEEPHQNSGVLLEKTEVAYRMAVDALARARAEEVVKA